MNQNKNQNKNEMNKPIANKLLNEINDVLNEYNAHCDCNEYSNLGCDICNLRNKINQLENEVIAPMRENYKQLLSYYCNKTNDPKQCNDFNIELIDKYYQPPIGKDNKNE